MNDDKPSMGGFTIVETMIVLAVTGFMLLFALLAFAGQQAKVEFGQSVRDMQSDLQQTINEVSSGFFPDSGNIGCARGGNKLEITIQTTEQGTNTDCIFMGKVLQFGVADTDPQQYAVFNLAGYKNNNGDLAASLPQVIDNESYISHRIIRNGVQVVSMKYVFNNVPIDISAVAIVSGLGNFEDGQFQSGSQQLNLIPVDNSGKVPNSVQGQVIQAVQDNLINSPVNPNGGVQICLQSGGTKQSGLITIGGNGRTTTVKLDMKSKENCA